MGEKVRERDVNEALDLEREREMGGGVVTSSWEVGRREEKEKWTRRDEM